MTKTEIAKELLKNTKSIEMQEFIIEYMSRMEEINVKGCIDKEFIRFDNCIDFIRNVNFNITGWMLFEIPIFYSHCFYNKYTKEAFDLAVWEEVIPRYMDDRANEQDADTIEEAIAKYDSFAYRGFTFDS